ncbi:MAG: glycosyltransferase family 2 protein [Lachnospiraceae bacterium]|nr:glycosyltransferase family 2 protein [Lachnospiraceae bacterium]
MTLEVLISALNVEPEKLLEKMNIQTLAVLVNQCDKDGREELDFNGNKIRLISSTERGVGKSRNACLHNSTADIVLFSDDDIIYENGYEKLVLSAFEENPSADMILFNMVVSEDRKTYWNDGAKKVTKTSCGRFPAYSIAAKREKLVGKNISFSLLFGGGAKYSNGEDSLFLTDCLRAGLKIYTSDKVLGKEVAESSTWFHGFNEKFFFDRGVLFAYLYKGFALLWAFRFVYLKKNIDTSGIGKKKAWKLIRDGIKEGNRLRKSGGEAE